MKLRVFEIDAIASKVIETITNSVTIPDFSKEVNKRSKLYAEFLGYLEAENRWQEKRKAFGKQHGFTPPNTWNGVQHCFTTKDYLNHLQHKYINSKLPDRKDIENAIILSGNKDLNDLVEELIKKYKQ